MSDKLRKIIAICEDDDQGLVSCALVLPYLRALMAVLERCDKLKEGPIHTVQETLGGLVADISAVIDNAARERGK